MNFDLIALALGDVAWISLAFVFGFIARSVGLPPLVGFLATGFLLNSQGIAAGDTLEKLANIGITLLLFTVGLKLNLRTLARPQVWAVAGLHTTVVVALFGFVIYGLALIGIPYVSNLDFKGAFLIAFALSFSSTVFAVKVLEEKGEMASLHGRIAVGILIMQDIIAVLFLAVSTGKWPSAWAFFLVLLIPLRFVLFYVLKRVGHGELLVLFGFTLALGGAELFELVSLKGDLGALLLGVLIASHPKAGELAKTMLEFKNLFLLGFFLSIGMSGQLTIETVLIGALIAPFVLIKSALFFALLAGFRLRARTSLLTSLNLTNFSEFGLIVAAIGVSNGWIADGWLIVMAITLAVSFVIAAGLNKNAHHIYARYQPTWRRMQRPKRLADDSLFNIDGATIVIIGMGGIGTGAYDRMRDQHGETLVGIDIDSVTVKNQQAAGRRVLLGDPSDSDFWDRVQSTHTLKTVMLALPKFSSNLAVLEQLKEASFSGKIAVTAKFDDEAEALKQAGATTVFNVYAEAGNGFASHVVALSP
ncbi:cation:proton antiporter [Arenicella xantha]|uniref:Transporter (CPA2 family) n=1 Tax=Arenicella xantha TaxID=644221 RepID=A0A395JM05_9GAMM|nr:cation:proton antiporter [Arenicella xantha]RBP50644.1 transporter (CPA2 family) [Arenicella xantha]